MPANESTDTTPMRRDWRTMTRADFDSAAPTVQTTLDGMPAAEPCGTADLFTLLD